MSSITHDSRGEPFEGAKKRAYILLKGTQESQVAAAGEEHERYRT